VTKYPFTKSFQTQGVWFLPQTPHATTAGTLSWSEDGALLAVFESFRPLRGAVNADHYNQYDVVHGTTVGSDRVTVLNAVSTSQMINIGREGMKQPEATRSSWLVVGDHVTQETVYEEVRVRIPGLQIWISISGIEQIIVDRTPERPASIHYRVPAMSEEVVHIDSVDAHFGWGLNRDFAGDVVSEISVVTSGWLTIKPASPQIFEWYVTQAAKVISLLSFVAGTAMGYDAIEAKIADAHIDVHVLLATRGTTCVFTRASDFFMLRSAMGVELEVVLRSWFSIYERIAAPIELALSVLSTKALWPNVEFLLLMQALEGFHRATAPGVYMPNEDYKKVRKTLNAAIPPIVSSSHKAALKSRIEYGNEISLRKRLAELSSRLATPIRTLLFASRGEPPQSWIDTRNYYTHWDQTARDGCLNALEMHRAATRMRLWLRCAYLMTMGIPHEAIARALVHTSREAQYLLQLNHLDRSGRDPHYTGGTLMHIGLADPADPLHSADRDPTEEEEPHDRGSANPT
jgi:hypothetical protein